MIRSMLRRLWRLPEQRCQSQLEAESVSMRDGVRLATWHVWPIDLEDEAPTVVMRTPYGVHGGRSSAGLLSRLIAESGFHVIVQDVRGRYGSEGRFTPFVNEGHDGADTLEWVTEQPWQRGEIGLWGASYLAHAAWCALAEAPERIGAMVSAIGSRRLYSAFYRGGALELANSFQFGLGIGETETVPNRRIDLERGLAHRPVGEADRVALREVHWLRDWIEHNREDEYWASLQPSLPTEAPPTLLIAGWYDFFLDPQFADFENLERLAASGESSAPRLIIGPWAHGWPARLGWWRHEMNGFLLRESIEHFVRHLRLESSSHTAATVKYFSAGRDSWNDSPTWPPPTSELRNLYLHCDPNAGSLMWEPATDEQAVRSFTYDPEYPCPTLGGALFGWQAGIKNQQNQPRSGNAFASYESEPLGQDLTLAGPVRLEVWFSSDSEDADVVARLFEVTPNGRVENICEGIQRSRWRLHKSEKDQPQFLRTDETVLISIELSHTARTIRTGHQLRLEIAGSNFPRYDRNPGTKDSPSTTPSERFKVGEHAIHHGPGSASRLILSIEA